MVEIPINQVEPYIKALHCPIRWKIIEILQSGPKTSNEIYSNLQNLPVLEITIASKKKQPCVEDCPTKQYSDLKIATLYYHLRELENTGIIKQIDYRPAERAPEKVWDINLDHILIKFK